MISLQKSRRQEFVIGTGWFILAVFLGLVCFAGPVSDAKFPFRRLLGAGALVCLVIAAFYGTMIFIRSHVDRRKKRKRYC